MVQWIVNLLAGRRERGFDPWSGKSPHAMEWLSPRVTTAEPGVATTEASPLEPVLGKRRVAPPTATRESLQSKAQCNHKEI